MVVEVGSQLPEVVAQLVKKAAQPSFIHARSNAQRSQEIIKVRLA